MTRSTPVLLLAALSLGIPTAPSAQTLTVSLCGGGTAQIPTGKEENERSSDKCCKGPCHANDERRKRRSGGQIACH